MAGLLKRKVGGTPLGNTFRAILNKASGGVLGNGLLMKKSTPTPAPQAVEAITSGIETVNEKISTNEKDKNNVGTTSKIMEWLKANKTTAILVGVGLAVVAFMFFKKNRKGGR